MSGPDRSYLWILSRTKQWPNRYLTGWLIRLNNKDLRRTI
ncbi:MAG: hypothetical protein HOP23_01200 [Methylococcaceae bacterium]|nr:hypothetical protein [Methylococcaceae bacterium]